MGAIDRIFKISERNSSMGTEVIAGLTTFFTMAYIVVVNPSILLNAGIPFTAGLTATCIGAAVVTALMGLIANRPLALASGMGINAVVAFSLCLSFGVDWRVAMACVLVEGVVILILVVCGLREAIMKALPVSIRQSIGIGIGLFIAFMGLKDAGLVVASESTFITFGDVLAPVAITGIVSILAAIIFTARNVPGGLLLSIVVGTIVGIPLGITVAPEEFNFGLDFSAFAAPLQATPEGTIALIEVFTKPMLLLFAFSLLMTDFFDTMGTALAIAKKADFATEDGDFLDARKILIVDSLGAVLGGFFGASSITTFVESASGAAAGARTGLSNLVIAALFVLCAFFAPVFGMVPVAATSGTLVVVGFLMMSDVGQIEWHKIELAVPAFLIILCIPLCYSITSGIGIGFIVYCIIMVFLGRAREVHLLMWISSAAFLLSFIFTAMV